jgi:CspA family cold shock protein
MPATSPDQNAGRIAGTVKWFDAIKGFGFLVRDDKAKDVFVHITDIRRAKIDPDEFGEGDRVTFELHTDGGGKTKAVELRSAS